MSEPGQDQVRQYLRFNPDGMEFAVVSLKGPPGSTLHDMDTEQIEGDFVALVSNESFTGCNIVFTRKAAESNGGVAVDQAIYLKVRNLGPVTATVKWVKDLDNDIARAGLEYID